MEQWLIVLGLINIALLIIGIKLLLPGKVFETSIAEHYRIGKTHLPYILIIIGVVVIHLIEVNFIDPHTTAWVGVDFAEAIQSIEGDAVVWFSQHWTPVLVYFFVLMYIAVYPFTLWFSILYFLLVNEKRPMKNLAYGLLLIYAIALPFYLFIPVTNVYVYNNIDSALETAIPTVERFFYSMTTQNNCLPSLHVAMAILVAWSVRLTGNKKFTYFAYFSMVSVIIAVIYLAIHWITDVICGMLLASAVILAIRHFIKEGSMHDTS